MIHDAARLPLPLRVRTDLCVIGSGAGGMAAAMTAAEEGLHVTVLEAGGFVVPECMTQREEEMLPELLVAGGGQTTSDRRVHIHQGRALGGSTVHNINLCKRIPHAILDEWRREHGLSHLPPQRWNTLYEEVEALLSVSVVDPSRYSRHNRILAAGCDALRWSGGGLSHNRSGCADSGFCMLGCGHDAKNNATKVLLPRLIRAGSQVLTHCRAVRVLHNGDRVSGVEAVVLHPRTRRPLGGVVIEAPRVCVSASATGTAAILQRSRVPDPADAVGNTLRIHPALVAAGEFDEPVRAWRGIPQTYECTEFLDFESDLRDRPGARTWIVPAFAHPVGTATMLPGRGREHAEMMARYDRLAVLTNMLHDRSAGTVRPAGDLGWTIDYIPNQADRDELLFGLAACARLLFAAGARAVYIPTDPVTVLSPGGGMKAIERIDLAAGQLDITAVHPMGSVPMGDDPRHAAVDSQGRHHHLEGLWVADGSLFPSSIGVPPQLSIYAMGLHVGAACART